MGYDEATRAEAIRLRVQEHLGLKDIAANLGLSKGTASLWLREHPLPKEIVKGRMEASGVSSRGRRKPRKPPQVREVTARFREVLESHEYTAQQLGTIAETAVLLRLHLHQYEVFRSTSEGSKVDWLIRDPETGKTAKVQVKSVRGGTHGLPTVPLRCGDGSRGSRSGAKWRRYREDEFDFIVGYDITTDTCYVWSQQEVLTHRNAVTIHPDAVERWDKLKIGV